MADEEKQVAVELAQLKEQVKTVGENVAEIKSTMSALISLDKTIAELAIYSKQTQDNIRLLWERYDEVKSWQGSHEADTAKIRKEIEDAIDTQKGECAKEILATDRKVDAWINQARGASWAAGIILGVVQVAIVAAVAWVFTNVTEIRERSQIHNLKIERLEQKKGAD
jgi:tetrahydromethanopterin S-methyltransferase subunit F